MGKSEKNGKVFGECMHGCEEICLDDNGKDYPGQNKKLQDLLGMPGQFENKQ